MVNLSKLMIGDWVKTNPGCGKLVCWIESNIAMVSEIEFSNLDGMYISLAGIKGRYYDDELEPIALTKEILLENEFSKYEDDENSYYVQGKDLPFRKYVINLHEHTFNVEYTEYVTDNKVLIKISDTNFVHELQHAIKLCGIEKSIKL